MTAQVDCPDFKPGLLGERPADSTAALLRERGVAADVVAAMSVVASIQRTASRIRNELEQGVLKRVSLTWSGFATLQTLWLYGELQTRHLAEEIGTNRSTLSGILNTLERRGLLTRRTHPSEGRLVLVALTEDGRALVDSVVGGVAAAQAEIALGLDLSAIGGAR